MSQYIFALLQQEIDLLDHQLLSQHSNTFKSFRKLQYSAYLSCLSSPDLNTHQICLKQAELTQIPLKTSLISLEKHKETLYECLNAVHTRSDPLQLTPKDHKDIDTCFLTFRKSTEAALMGIGV